MKTSSQPLGTLYRCSRCISMTFTKPEAEDHMHRHPGHTMSPLLEIREERKR